MLYETSEKIYELEKQGKKIIKLNIGEPDWRPTNNVIKGAIKALKEAKDKYGSSAGEFELREKIAILHDCSIKNVVIVPGSKWGIYALLRTNLKAGNNAIIFSPHWTAYELMCKELGIIPKIINLKMENKFAADFDALDKAIDQNTKFIILNSPSNPTSIAWKESEEQEIIEIARKKGITVIADDAYRNLCFDARLERKFQDNLHIANTFSKTFGMTGWRIGYIIADEEAAKRVIKLNQITISNVPVFLQAAAKEALFQKAKMANKARRLCKKRAKIAVDILKKNSSISFSEPNAGFYIFPKLPEHIDTISFINKLLLQGIAVTPGAAFGNYSKHIRISLCTDEEILRSALEKIVMETR